MSDEPTFRGRPQSRTTGSPSIGAAVSLPRPAHAGGLPLYEALAQRHSTRAYSNCPLPAQVLSNLLWAAYGINRPGGERTAPYWRHVMVIDVYAALSDGVWRYDAEKHALILHLPHDIRAQTGRQDFIGTAPLDLIYVAQGERMAELSAAERRLYASVDAAFIGENIYLCAACEGLGTVFRGGIDYDRLERALQLHRNQFVTFAQTVGYPATVC